jgi:hypothetical protein
LSYVQSMNYLVLKNANSCCRKCEVILSAKSCISKRREKQGITEVLNTRQNIVLNKKLNLIARQDDQEHKHKSLIRYIELEGVQEQLPRICTRIQEMRCQD